jgi:hypothetical protein
VKKCQSDGVICVVTFDGVTYSVSYIMICSMTKS